MTSPQYSDSTRYGRRTSLSPSLHRSNSIPGAAEWPESRQFKTELCRSLQGYSQCWYGERCRFAHGLHELRPPVRHSRYRTRPCYNYHVLGLCNYGSRCSFIHSGAEVLPDVHDARHWMPAYPDSNTADIGYGDSGPVENVQGEVFPIQHVPGDQGTVSEGYGSCESSPDWGMNTKKTFTFEFPF